MKKKYLFNKGGHAPPFAMRSEFAWLIPCGRTPCVLQSGSNVSPEFLRKYKKMSNSVGIKRNYQALVFSIAIFTLLFSGPTLARDEASLSQLRSAYPEIKDPNGLIDYLRAKCRQPLPPDPKPIFDFGTLPNKIIIIESEEGSNKVTFLPPLPANDDFSLQSKKQKWKKKKKKAAGRTRKSKGQEKNIPEKK